MEESAAPHKQGARRLTPHKSETSLVEVAMLLNYDFIGPSKLLWDCHGRVKMGIFRILLRLSSLQHSKERSIPVLLHV